MENKRKISVASIVVGIVSIGLGLFAGLAGAFQGFGASMSGSASDLAMISHIKSFISYALIGAGVFSLVNLNLKNKIFTILSMITFGLVFIVPIPFYYLSTVRMLCEYGCMAPTSLILYVVFSLAFFIATLVSFIVNFKNYRK